MYHKDWSDLAFASKKELNDLNATFIVAPRDISVNRFKQLIKDYLPKGNIVVGIAKEAYISGFEGQPQFKTLRLASIEKIIDKTNDAKLVNKVYTLSYFQRDAKFIIEKIKFQKAVLINGSWKYLFHTLPIYYALVSKKLDYELVSPFSSENEARVYDTNTLPTEPKVTGTYNSSDMLKLAGKIAERSFDHAFQTGITLGRKKNSKYQFIAQAFNKVVPYQAYAMHHGSVRETNFSPTNDLNFYDTIHAEVSLIVFAQKNKLDLKGTTVFINLLPCPNCARMLGETDIVELVYREDHSEGIAANILENAGKKTRRVVK